ncbi:NDNF [Pelobates cultripes]|uniref:Protein NDNF n=2 Tax=Pelobates cultripes TaxID=61616 RepID=A0AAD1VZR2_PELCU|nr:NDNF [Pelobates cultripes]
MEKIILLLICIYPSSNYLHGHVLSQSDANHPVHIVGHLPIGHRVDAFLPRDKAARYYIALNESRSAVTIKVIPCESPLYWALYVLDKKDDLSPLEDGFKDLGGYHAEQQQHRHVGPRRLFSFQGNGEESFPTIMTVEGFYFIDFVSLESDTNFQVFVWDNRNQANPWPQLPSDPRVDIGFVEDTKVQLSWKPSLGPSDTGTFEYCVFVNKHYNFKTLCATEFNLKRQLDWNEQDDQLSNFVNIAKKTSRNHASHKIKKNMKGSSEWNVNNDLWSSKHLLGGQKVCVGSGTNATISGLKPRTLYYLDVFAVNPKYGTSVAYTGTFTETKPKHRSHIPKVPSDEIMNIFLKSHGVKILNLDPPAHGYKWLYVHSCLHKVHLQITSNRNTLVSQSLQGAHNFKLSVNSNKYTITLKSSRGGPGLVKLFTTSTPNRLPFPNLPPDINLSVSNRSCSSATATWAGTGPGTKVCIFVRHLEQNLDLKLIHKHQNSCLSTSARSRAEKVFCRQEGPETLTEEHITDLKPGKAYLIDLYFLGQYNSTIKFPSHVVRTQEHCT